MGTAFFEIFDMDASGFCVCLLLGLPQELCETRLSSKRGVLPTSFLGLWTVEGVLGLPEVAGGVTGVSVSNS